MSSESWDQYYSQEGYCFGTDPNDFLRENVSKIPRGGKVLCLAAGEGRNAVFLARLGYQVTAVDRSAVGLRKLGRLAQNVGVKVEGIHADLAFHDLGRECWDGIVSIWAHLGRETRLALHQSCVAGLKPNGVFLLEAYTPRQLEIVGGKAPKAEKYMTRGDLIDELAGLFISHAVEIDRPVIEGRAHVAEKKYSVVQIVAAKPK